MTKNKKNKHYEPILAIDPTVRGFGYIVLEGPRNPIDWGVAHVRICKNKRIVKRINGMIEMYQPHTIIIEESKCSLRCKRVKDLLSSLEALAIKQDVQVVKYSRQQVLDVFKNFNRHNKFEIAEHVAKWLPPLAPKLPSRRNRHEAESEQYGLFDAAALGLTHLYLTE